MTETSFPLRADGRGRTAVATPAGHVAELVEAVLFTAPGERVNRPDFGCGLTQLLFAPVDPTIVGTAEIAVRSGLQRWIGDVIDVGDVAVDLADTAVQVTVRYRVRGTGVDTIDTFERRA